MARHVSPLSWARGTGRGLDVPRDWGAHPGGRDGGRGLPKASLHRPHCSSAGPLGLPREQQEPRRISLRLHPKRLRGPADKAR